MFLKFQGHRVIDAEKQPKTCVPLLSFPLEPWQKIYRSHPKLALFQNTAVSWVCGKDKL